MAQLGVYGLRIDGLDGAEPWMQPQPANAPLVRVIATEADPDTSRSHVDAESADIGLLDGGRLRARKSDGVLRYELPEVPPASDLLHPYLAPGAALLWQWAGHEALHAGAVALGDGAVLVVGQKESGKSSILAWLAEHESITVLADDLAIVRNGEVLAGPRSIDLRTEDAIPGSVSVRGGHRRRLTLPPGPTSLPVRGTVVLRWGEVSSLEQMGGKQRLTALAAERSYYLIDGDPATLLKLAALPMATISRPRTETVAQSAQTLLQLFA